MKHILKFLLLLILSYGILIFGAAVAFGQTAPAQASAAGYSNLVFDDEFNGATYSTNKGTAYVSGANWYPYVWCTPAASAINITGGVLTLGGGDIATIPTYSYSDSASAKNTFLYGYFEASFKFSVNQSTNASSQTQPPCPSFWLMGSQMNSTGAFQMPEIDVFEAWPLGGTGAKSIYPIQTLHNWSYPGSRETANTNNSNLMVSLQGTTESASPTDGGYHTYGALWYPTGSNTAAIQFYYDNHLVVHSGNITTYKVGAGTSFPAFVGNYVTPVLQAASSQPITVDFVRVWQGGSSTGTSTGTGSTTPPVLTAQTLKPATVTIFPVNVSLPSSTSAGLPVTYSIAGGPATVSGDTLTITGSGSIALNATQAGNATYAPFSETETLTIP